MKRLLLGLGLLVLFASLSSFADASVPKVIKENVCISKTEILKNVTDYSILVESFSNLDNEDPADLMFGAVVQFAADELCKDALLLGVRMKSEVICKDVTMADIGKFGALVEDECI